MIDKKKYAEKSQLLKRGKKQLSLINDADINIETVLDIGASTGYVLSLYKQKGCIVEGIEPSDHAAGIAKGLYGIDLFHGMFDDYFKEFKEKKFDLVTLSHVLEHIENPLNFMEKVSQINQKYIYIEVPSITEKFVDEPFGLFAEEHLNYFSVFSLNYLMKKSGYCPIEIKLDYCINERIANGFPMITSLWEKKDNNYDLNPIINSRMVLEKYMKNSEIVMESINKIIDKIDDNEKLAVWGVSFQTERLWAYTNLKEKNVIKFYDNSQLRRQSRVFGLPVEEFKITDIADKKIDKILIAPYNSQPAILGQLMQYNIADRIITLY